MSEIHTFSAHVVTQGDKDEVLAAALQVIDGKSPVESYVARRIHDDVVFVQVKFWDEQGAAVATARLTGETIGHRWPTDTLRLDGRPVKHHQKGA